MRKLILLTALLGCTTAADDDLTGTPADSRTVGSVEFSAQTLVMESFPVQLRTIVTAHNTSGTPAQLVFPDGCVVLMRAHRGPDRAGAPAWDQARMRVCTAAIVEEELAPGESRTFESYADARDVLGDSLPDGRYHLVAVIRPASEDVELSAGVADLAVPR